MPIEDPFVTVASFTTLGEAGVARLALEAAGIPCELADAEAIAMDWLMSNAFGGVKVQVPESEVAHAKSILARRHRDATTDDYGLPRISPRDESESDADDFEPEAADDEAATPADKIVDRAFVFAVLGLFSCPFLTQLVSLGMLLQLLSEPSRVQPHKRFRLWTTIVIDVSLVSFILFVVAAYFRGPQ
jgi:hypothetical protein